MFGEQRALKIDNLSYLGKEFICLLTNRVKILSSSGTEVGKVCSYHSKRLGYPQLGIFQL